MKFEAIDDFLNRVKQLSRSGSKDMRLSFQEANILAITIAELLTHVGKQATAAPAQSSAVVAPSVIDGGTFKDRKG